MKKPKTKGFTVANMATDDRKAGGQLGATAAIGIGAKGKDSRLRRFALKMNKRLGK
jgi:hypothetical protein